MSRSAVAGLLTILLLLPSSAADWSAQGAHEPSTPYDRNAALMFQDAPPPGERRVYFNAFTMVGSSGAGSGLVNPNVALLGTDNEVLVMQYHEAILGVWNDCNGDGYVGMLEGGVREYSNTILLDRSRCPATSGSVNSWNGAHNYNGWVTELIPIGNRETRPGDARVFVDLDAAVWGDAGRPMPEAAAPDPSLVVPLPRFEAPPKKAADWNFHFTTTPRGTGQAGAMARGSAGADAALGVGNDGTRWVADSYTVGSLPRTYKVGAGSVDFADPQWFTFYARVGAATLGWGAQTPSSSFAIYGAERCGTNSGGVHHGWDCDADAWYTHGDGTPYHPTLRNLARPGQPYQLRDVDCHDGSNDVGVATGVTAYGSRPCVNG